MKTNAQLYQDIMNKLEFDPAVVSTDITIKVGSLWEKHAAERAVKRVAGVKGVANELQVELSSLWGRSDADIANAAVSAIKWNALVPRDRIQVSVEDGRATLIGSVNWQFQREAAGR